MVSVEALPAGEAGGEGGVVERRIINPWGWQDEYGFVQANEVSDTQRVLYCAGQVSVDAEGNPLHPGDMSAQIAQSLDNLETVLDNAGFEMSDVVRLNFNTTDVDSTLEAWSSQIKDRLAQSGCRQVSTLLGVAGLYHPDILIEIEATAVA
jgi:enamine deaminase RidA (YjgF/YER057c/UK114 family)